MKRGSGAWALLPLSALLACSRGTPGAPAPRMLPEALPSPPLPAADDTTTTGGREDNDKQKDTAPPTPKVELTAARFLPLAASFSDPLQARVLLGEVTAHEGDDDQWYVADGVGASMERTEIEIPASTLAKADLKELPALPSTLTVVGPKGPCKAKLPEHLEVELDTDGFGVAKIFAVLSSCADIPGPLAPVAVADVDVPDELRWVGAKRPVLVSEGKVERGEADPLTARIVDQPTKARDPEYARGKAEGFVDALVGVEPPVVGVFAGMIWAHAPKTLEPDPCLEDADWSYTLGQRGPTPGSLVEYPSHPESPEDFDLRGALVYAGHVQALVGHLALDRAVLLPGARGFTEGTWRTISTGTHHDEDVAFAGHRIGHTCEP